MSELGWAGWKFTQRRLHPVLGYLEAMISDQYDTSVLINTSKLWQ